MKNKLSIFLAPAFICWCLLLIQGCKEPAITDKELQGEGLDLVKDTLETLVFSQFVKPAQSNGVTVGVLGSLADPNFGRSYAGFYAQCRLTSNNIFFGTNPVLDSVVLTLRYTGKYGKFTEPLNLSVFELNQDLLDSVPYYTTTAFAVNASPVGTKDNFIPNLTDSVPVLGRTYAPHLRVPLSAAFGNKILLADAATLSSNAAFLNVVKGLYVTSNSSFTGNGITFIDLNNALSKVTVYYHNATADSLLYDLPFAQGVKVNHIDNIYTGSPVQLSVTSPNPAGESKMYIQGGSGVRGKVLLPDFDSLPKNISVNKAELVLTVSAADTAYPAPLLLDLLRIDDVGEGQRLEDEALSAFGGTLGAETVSGSPVYRYRFNIKYYFQKVIKGIYKNNGLYVQSVFSNNSTERLVLDNPTTNKNYKVTLIVTYTKL